MRGFLLALFKETYLQTKYEILRNYITLIISNSSCPPNNKILQTLPMESGKWNTGEECIIPYIEYSCLILYTIDNLNSLQLLIEINSNFKHAWANFIKKQSRNQL